MKPYFETTCDNCGVIDEANFIHHNCDIEVVCNSCGSHIKYISFNKLIDVETVKERIFEIVKGDLNEIAKAKKEINFPTDIENNYLRNLRLLYWKLYLQIIKEYKIFNY